MMSTTQQTDVFQQSSRAIIHLDMDAFYPAVEVLDDPALRGLPVIVGGSSHRGVVASASYEARKFGVHSAMSIAEAKRRCPKGVFLPVRMQRYKEISQTIFAIYERYTPLVEPLSIDEAFLDVSGSMRLFGTPQEIAATIKRDVQQELNLSVSAGVASNKSVAKIASDYQKPNGLTVVEPGTEQQFLNPLQIERLWGAGPITCKSLRLLGVQTIGDLARLSPELLIAKFGKQGEAMHRLARGIDEREVESAQGLKSIGNEETFSEDIVNADIARQELLALATKVGGRLRHKATVGRTISLKVKYNDFKQITRSATLTDPVDDGNTIYRQCCSLLEKTEVGRRPVRLLGVTVSNLCDPEAPRQQSLFDDPVRDQKTESLNRAVDSIQDTFGEGTIVPGTLLKKS
jgi:DNA polymerase-4